MIRLTSSSWKTKGDIDAAVSGRKPFTINKSSVYFGLGIILRKMARSYCTPFGWLLLCLDGRQGKNL